MKKKINPRDLPSVHATAASAAGEKLMAEFGHEAVVAVIREIVDGLRASLLDGKKVSDDEIRPEAVIALAGRRLAEAARPRLRPAVNATGIILHTGLGRAVMPGAVSGRLAESTGYCTVQMDVETGERIRREECIRDLVRDLTGAEDCALVNNNAGATLLVLRALAQGREAVISRGELIEIGGSFRLPDIMGESGAILREVGTTNKTHPKDYERAIGPKTALLMKAHKSNYSIVGFSEEVGIGEIAAIARKHTVATVDDLGCGAMVALEAYGLPHEVTVKESLAAGADLALFSTDKLIGGPQGGLIVGRQELVDKVRQCPLYRALRVCKLTLAALEATLKLFKAPDRLPQTHPLYAMLARKPVEIERQARALADELARRRKDWNVSVVPSVAFLGGGSLPGAELPTFAVRIVSDALSADALSRLFRSAAVPVIPRVKEDALLLDMRTVSADETRLIILAAAGESESP